MKSIFDDHNYLLWRLISQTKNAMQKARARELAFYDIKLREAAVIMIIEASGGMVNAYKIARWTVTEPHTISVLLNRMEADGFIKRTGIIIDKERTPRIELTSKGRKAYEKIMIFESLNKVTEVLTEEEKTTLDSMLKKLRNEALKQIRLRAKLPFPPF
ncbi:MAG: MarR family winged helix-turn-helix transcriptional regulator [Dehalococcoidales bacterium]